MYNASIVHLLQPTLNRLGDELRTVVAANVLRHATHREQLRQRVDHVLARDAPIHLQSQALPRVLIDDLQPLQRAALGRAIEHEVPAPHVVLVLRPPLDAAILTLSQTSSFSLLLRHFQPFPTPQPIDPRVAGLPDSPDAIAHAIRR